MKYRIAMYGDFGKLLDVFEEQYDTKEEAQEEIERLKEIDMINEEYYDYYIWEDEEE